MELTVKKQSATAASPLSTTMTTGTDLLTPPPILPVKHQKKAMFDHIFCRLYQNQPPAPPKQAWKILKA
jgi:hypothetical protein